MKLLSLAALVAVAMLSASCSGCAPIQAAISSDHAVLEGQKVDEQALGAVDALGSSANILLKEAAESGLASRDQLLMAQSIRKDMDVAHDAARAAYDAGDAQTFAARLAAVTRLNNRAQALLKEVKQ